MKKTRFTEEQIAFALREAETGSTRPVKAALRTALMAWKITGPGHDQ